MTTSQHRTRRHAPSGSQLRRALSRTARALRTIHGDQVNAWDRYFHAGLPGQPRR